MNKELTTKKIVQGLGESWYQELLNDLKQLAWTKTVEIKHAIGKRILEDELKFGKAEYGSKRMENLAKDLQGSTQELYRCIQFAKKYPELSHAVRELSWHNIANNLLPAPKKERIKPIPLPKGKYNIIYADPAWEYFAGGYKNQQQHYNSMPLEDICKLPVGELADENCILFMWVTFPMLDDFIDVLRCWGFEYSTVGFVWVKSKKDKTGFAFGLGNWTRSNAEICVIATRGSVVRQDASISQIIYEPKQEHSKKPDIVRDKIVQLVGDLPRIELFARQKTKGWEVWGNQC